MRRSTRFAIAVAIATTTILPLAAADSAGVKLPPYETHRLDNGLRLILMEKHDVPLIAFHARIAGGDAADAQGKEGSAEVLTEWIQKGAGKRDARAFPEAVDSVGGTLSAWSTREAVTLNGEFLARDRGLMLELLADMLMRPKLDVAEFEKIRQRSIEEIAAAKDNNPNAVIATYFSAFLFGEHPYGRSSDETSLAALDADTVKAYFRDHLGADRAVLAVVGDFEAGPMKAALEKALGGWGKAAAKPPKIDKTKPTKGRRVLLVDKPDATQTFFRMGNVGVARDDKHRVALDLANTAFGGRFTSMLNTELRIKTGLSYGAGCSLMQYRQPGAVAIRSFTKTESTEEALDRTLQVLSGLRENGLSAESLASVQAYVAGQFPPELETGTQLASRLTEIEFYGLDRSDVDDYAKHVAAADESDVSAVIGRVYPKPENLTVVLIGNADAIRDVAKKYGEVTEMKITDRSFRPGG